MIPGLYRRTSRAAYCAGIIVFALLLRLALLPGAAARFGRGFVRALGSRTLFEAVLFLETGIAHPAVLTAEAAASDVPQPAEAAAALPEPAAPAETAAPAPVSVAPFTAAEAEAISLRGNCSYEADKTALLLRPLGWQEAEGPRILIIHTHSCEAYTPSEGHTYVPDGNYRTLEQGESVIAVGDALADALGALGVEVIHDRTWNDYPSYNRSYAVAREKILDYLEQYPSLVMVVDLHRDALEEPVREAVTLEGETCAKLMLVVGTDEGGLYHPHWADNLSCALKLQALLNWESPGLCRDLSFRRERFNGDLTPGSLIVEVGATGNTLPEALASMPRLAAALVRLLAIAGETA